MQRRYVHGPSADEPLVCYEGSDTSNRRFLHADERGSIVAVTNSTGGIVAINSYDEYGIPALISVQTRRGWAQHYNIAAIIATDLPVRHVYVSCYAMS